MAFKSGSTHLNLQILINRLLYFGESILLFKSLYHNLQNIEFWEIGLPFTPCFSAVKIVSEINTALAINLHIKSQFTLQLTQ